MAILRVRKGKFPDRVHAVFDSVKPTLIGRDASAHISLEDERASRRHARILRAHGSWLLQDLGSSNGTFVDRQRIDKIRLEDGLTIQIGNTLLSFHADEWPPAPAEEVYGARLVEVVGEEGGVVVHKAYQAAMDREVRVDKLAPGWRLATPVREAVERALEEAAKATHRALDSLVHGVVRNDGGYAIFRSRGGEPLSCVLGEILGEPLFVRLSITSQLVDALLARAVWQSLRSPIGLHQILIARSADRSFEVSLPAVELRALATERTGGLPHLPTYAPYLPPEIARLSGPPEEISFPSTMYVLGAIGYHLLTGHPPMGEVSVRKIIENHQQLEPAPANLVCPEIQESLSALLSRMLAKDPADRPAGRMEVAAVLEEAMRECPPPAAPADVVATRPLSRPSPASAR
ncbi:MAG: FHA domain-containing protein, partial [Planctomycetes bacterium]|nr:FHA domain-containing protein [Planctomycetota bacterium]